MVLTCTSLRYHLKKFESGDVTDFIGGGLFVQRKLGLFPLDEALKLSKLAALRGGTLLALCQALTAINYFDDTEYFYEGSERRLFAVVECAQAALAVLFYDVSFVLHFQAGYSRMLEGAIRLDGELRGTGRGGPVYNSLKPVAFGVWFALIAIIHFTGTVRYSLMEYSTESAWRYSIDSFFILAVVHLTGGPLCLCLRLLGSQFAHLVSCLRLPVDEGFIERLVDFHSGLCDLSDDLNSVAGPQLLATSFVTFCTVITSLFCALTEFKAGIKTGVMSLTISYAFQMIFWSSHLFYLVASCELVVKQSTEFNRKLFKLMIEDKVGHLAGNEKLQMHITTKREARFSACSLFTMDLGLIHSMVAAATTYLVILFQFNY